MKKEEEKESKCYNKQQEHWALGYYVFMKFNASFPTNTIKGSSSDVSFPQRGTGLERFIYIFMIFFHI